MCDLHTNRTLLSRQNRNVPCLYAVRRMSTKTESDNNDTHLPPSPYRRSDSRDLTSSRGGARARNIHRHPGRLPIDAARRGGRRRCPRPSGSGSGRLRALPAGLGRRFFRASVHRRPVLPTHRGRRCRRCRCCRRRHRSDGSDGSDRRSRSRRRSRCRRSRRSRRCRRRYRRRRSRRCGGGLRSLFLLRRFGILHCLRWRRHAVG